MSATPAEIDDRPIGSGAVLPPSPTLWSVAKSGPASARRQAPKLR